MAVELTDTSANFTGTGVLSNYSAPIYANDDAQIKVFVDDVLQTLGDDYILNGLGSSTGISIDATFTLGAAVYVERDTAIKQKVDTQNNETILEDVIDAGFDKLTMIAQENAGKTARAILVPKGEQGFKLPATTSRSNRILGFDVGGGLSLPFSVSDIAAAILNATAALANQSVAGMVLFLQTGIGALARTLQSKSEDYPSVKDWGAKGIYLTDPLNDDGPGLRAALAKQNTGTAGSYQLFVPDGQYYVPGAGVGGDAGQRLLSVQGATALFGLALEGTFFRSDATSVVSTFIEDSGSGAKTEMRNMTFFGSDNPNITTMVRLGVRGVQFGTYGTVDNLTARNAPNAWAFDFDVNIIAAGDLYSLNTKHGLRAQDGGSGYHGKGFYPISWSAMGLWLGGVGDSVLNTEFEAPDSDDAVCVYQSRPSSVGLGSTMMSIQNYRTVKTPFGYNPTFSRGFRCGPIQFIRGGTFTGYGDITNPAASGTATAVGVNTLTDNTKNWKRDQFKTGGIFIKNIFTASMSGGTLDVTAVQSGSIRVGQVITGAGILAGQTITGFLTGTGGTGTYSVSIGQTVGSITMTMSPTWAQVAGNTKDTITIVSSSWAGITPISPIVGTQYAVDFMAKAGTADTTTGAFTASGAGHMGSLDLTLPDAAIVNMSNDAHRTNESLVGSSNEAQRMTQRMSKVANLDFPLVAGAGGVQSLTVAFPDAAVGDAVKVTAPFAILAAGLIVDGAVTAAGTVTVYVINPKPTTPGGDVNPAADNFTVEVRKYV